MHPLIRKEISNVRKNGESLRAGYRATILKLVRTKPYFILNTQLANYSHKIIFLQELQKLIDEEKVVLQLTKRPTATRSFIAVKKDDGKPVQDFNHVKRKI